MGASLFLPSIVSLSGCSIDLPDWFVDILLISSPLLAIYLFKSAIIIFLSSCENNNSDESEKIDC